MTQVPKDILSKLSSVKYSIDFKLPSGDSSSIPISIDSIRHLSVKYSINDISIVGSVYITDYFQIIEVLPPNIQLHFTYTATDVFEMSNTETFAIIKTDKVVLEESDSYIRFDFVDSATNYFSSLFKSRGFSGTTFSKIYNEFYNTPLILDKKSVISVSDKDLECYVVPSNIPFTSTLYNLELHTSLLLCQRRTDIIITDVDNIYDKKIQFSKTGANGMIYTNDPRLKESFHMVFNFIINMNDREKSQTVLGKSTVYAYDETSKSIFDVNKIEVNQMSYLKEQTTHIPYILNYFNTKTNKLVELPYKNLDTLEYIYKMNMLSGVTVEIEVRGCFAIEPLKTVQIQLLSSNRNTSDNYLQYFGGEYTVISVEDIIVQSHFSQKIVLGRNYIEKPIKPIASNTNTNVVQSAPVETPSIKNTNIIGSNQQYKIGG